LEGKTEGKRSLGKPRRSWVVNNKMGLREIRWGGVYWIDLAQDRDQWRALANTKTYFWFHNILGSSYVAAQLGAS
jgi:hypothetical protein